MPENEQIYAEARDLLDSGLRAILERHGELHVMGSYALRLMTWRDLDLHLVRPTSDVASFFALGSEIATLLKPERMHFRDETRARTTGLPVGLYWGIYLGDERNGAWKIDLWETDREGFESARQFTDRIASALTDENRATILAIKSQCWRHPRYRRDFSAADIYFAVLERGVRNIDEFWSDLGKTRRLLYNE